VPEADIADRLIAIDISAKAPALGPLAHMGLSKGTVARHHKAASKFS